MISRFFILGIQISFFFLPIFRVRNIRLETGLPSNYNIYGEKNWYYHSFLFPTNEVKNKNRKKCGNATLCGNGLNLAQIFVYFG